MKNLIFIFGLFVIILSSCGKAAEDREAMYARAKVFQDSIAAVIKKSMDEAAAPPPGGQAVPTLVTPTGQATPTTTK